MGGDSAERPALSSTELRREISARNLARGEELDCEVSYGASQSVIFRNGDGGHGNFLAASYARIVANPAWKQRLTKSYTASRYVPRAGDRKRYELECASSSDALLMNVFCYPGVLRNARVCALLGIEVGLRPEFGFRPEIPLKNGRCDRTEMDMRLGGLLVEAKLTEGDFQRAPLRLVERYRDLEEVLDVERLPVAEGVVRSYQLIRCVLAAQAPWWRVCGDLRWAAAGSGGAMVRGDAGGEGCGAADAAGAGDMAGDCGGAAGAGAAVSGGEVRHRTGLIYGADAPMRS